MKFMLAFCKIGQGWVSKAANNTWELFFAPDEVNFCRIMLFLVRKAPFGDVWNTS